MSIQAFTQQTFQLAIVHKALVGLITLTTALF